MPRARVAPAAYRRVALVIRVAEFVHDLRWAQVPEPVRERVRTAILDTAAVGCAGATLPVADAWSAVARADLGAAGPDGARVLGLNLRAPVPVAAMVGAGLVDAFDAHDGHPLCKGHAGAAVVPAALAWADARGTTDWVELALGVLVGYEVATRAGIALHATAAIHHSSGAWNALGVAALGARGLGLDRGRTREALGIAEYSGPRSPLLRVARHPTMVKDGSAFGAFTGALAASLAASGFTGAPAELVEHPAVGDLWADLGTRWRILEHYVKPWPVCRWVQPAVEAVLDLRRRHPSLAPEDVTRVRVSTFADAVSLDTRAPREADAAQYSLPFAVAVALVHAEIRAEHLTGGGLDDPDVLRVAGLLDASVDATAEARYPAERWARVEIVLRDGATLDSGRHTTRGDPDRPLTATEVEAKVRSNCAALGSVRAERFWRAGTAPRPDLRELLDALLG